MFGLHGISELQAIQEYLSLLVHLNGKDLKYTSTEKGISTKLMPLSIAEVMFGLIYAEAVRTT